MRMISEPNFPPRLDFVEKAPDDGTLLRLMVLNPFNDEMCTFVNAVIETDPQGFAPGAGDLHVPPPPTS
jgi:hypothetical protein